MHRRKGEEKIAKKIAKLLQEEEDTNDEEIDIVPFMKTGGGVNRTDRENDGVYKSDSENMVNAETDKETCEHVEGDSENSNKENGGNDNSMGVNSEFEEESMEDRGTRKRKRKEWKREILKRKVNNGEEHESISGAKVPKKEPKQLNKHPVNCRTKCTMNFTQEDRVEICQRYWEMGNHQRQRDWLCSVLEKKDVKSHCSDATRQKGSSITYYLMKDNQKVRVCREYFCSTLCISRNLVDKTMKYSNDRYFEREDNRGKHQNRKKIPEDEKHMVRTHINSFPRVESHYTRKDSNREYLVSDIKSVAQMHRLYEEQTHLRYGVPVKLTTYKNIFYTEFNIGFFQPKKDQCPRCSAFNNMTAEEKEEKKSEHENHLRLKEEMREIKSESKDKAMDDQSHYMGTFDLEAVLPLPKSDVGTFYYKRRLSVFNLTVHTGADKEVDCYTWSEIDGRRGASEIGTCLLTHLKNLDEKVETVDLFSDACGGQNRNQFIAAVLLYAVHVTKLREMRLNFLESGHTHMECDSVHSAIEYSQKNLPVFSVNEWNNIIRSARPGRHPYRVHQLQWYDFVDAKQLAAETISNRKTDIFGNTVNWLKLKRLVFRQESPNSMFYSYDGRTILNEVTVRKRHSGRHVGKPDIQKLYSGKLPISKAKKEDLLSLCSARLIPDEYIHFYENLEVS